MRRRYPGILGVIQQLRSNAEIEWPDWCWLPMGASVAALDVFGGPPVDIARVAALAAWRVDRGVYWTTDAAARLDQVNPDGRLDTERLTAGLPQWCCYVAIPTRADGVFSDAGLLGWPLGVYVHAEWDPNTRRPELRLLVDTDGTWDGLVGVWVEVDRLRGPAVDITRELRGLPPAGDGVDDPFRASSQIAAFAVWPMVLALTAEDTVIVPAEADRIGRPQRARPDASGRWRGAERVSRWVMGL